MSVVRLAERNHRPSIRLRSDQVRKCCKAGASDELFFVEEERHVRSDNTLSFKSLRWEAPRHLPDRTIQIRFQRKDPTVRVVVFYPLHQ